MNFQDLFLQQEITKLKSRYSIFEICIKDILNRPSHEFLNPNVMQPIEKINLDDSSIEIKHLFKNRLIAYFCLKRNTKLIFGDCNVILHIIILFGHFKLNGKLYLPKDHVIMHKDSLVESEFVYFQLVTKFAPIPS